MQAPQVSSVTLSQSPNGIHATFIKVNDKFGLKVYRDAKLRNQSYRNQNWLAKRGFAPKVWSCVDVPVCDGCNTYTMYGFFTRIVETTDITRLYDMGQEPYARKINTDIKTLTARLAEIGIDWFDNHAGNIGWDNGTPVIIDCADWEAMPS